MTLETDVVSVPVGDQDRAKTFYVEQLGFEEIADTRFGDGMQWVQLKPPAGRTSITLVTCFDRMPPGSVQGLVLATDDVHGAYERLRERGVEFRRGVEQAPWGTFTTFEGPSRERLSSPAAAAICLAGMVDTGTAARALAGRRRASPASAAPHAGRSLWLSASGIPGRFKSGS